MYKTRISSDYFTKQGLETRAGILSGGWYIVLLKELIDNALDAIEAEPDKKIVVEYDCDGRILKIFDNGGGLSIADVKAIYDFDNYISKNRHIINISRGKQGNGLKCVVGICRLCNYNLLWHTNENIIICPKLDTTNAQDGEIYFELHQTTSTDCKGIEVQGVHIDDKMLCTIVKQFSDCNNDVLFEVNSFENRIFAPKIEAVNKQSETSLLFYTFEEYKRLLSVQDPNMNYKTFLQNIFGTRVGNASAIKRRIKDINISDAEYDFYNLQNLQRKKPLTLLKKHLIGYKNIIEQYPYIIEYEVKDAESGGFYTCVMINNSITYFDASSVGVDRREYHITAAKKVDTDSLNEILNAFKDSRFHIHIITPTPIFKDFGKTKIDISEISHLLVDDIRKTVNREKRKSPSVIVGKPKSKKELAFENMNEAFNLASSGGKYGITARQMYYKIRELIGDDEWETPSTYSSFTQDWLTQWLDDNPQYEDKVNFSDRGMFIIGGVSKGIGSVNVRTFLADDKLRANCFTLNADINMSSSYDFDVSYQYDKVLYIEKTGFNEIFLAVGIQEKYNVLIVSGQGYASRSARQLLYDLQQKGLKIYCMHDLDVAGMTIFDSIGRANDKFKYDIDIADLGITPSDVAKYHIIPEKVKAVDESVLLKFSPGHQSFFRNAGEYSRRVELNAFTTEQLLEIIDDKLADINQLPTFDISTVVKANEQKLKEYALFQLVRSKYEEMLKNISVGDNEKIYPADSTMTFYEMQVKMPEIENKIIDGLVIQLEKMTGL